MVKIRNVEATDEAQWRRLWAAYIAFYEAEVPSEVSDSTWRRLLDPGSGLLGRVAVEDGKVIGFANCVLHPATWTATPVCYLEDLFVEPDCRGSGVGRALMLDLIGLAKAKCWSRLYWHTRATNVQARRLYDTFTHADGFVRYRLIF